MVQQFNFQITAYTTGELSIPPVPVIIAKDKTPVRAVLAEDIRIRIAPVTSEADMEIKDIKAPLDAPYNYKPLIIAGIIVLSFIALAVAAYFIVARMRRPAQAAPEPLPEPEVLALKELAETRSPGPG